MSWHRRHIEQPILTYLHWIIWNLHVVSQCLEIWHLGILSPQTFGQYIWNCGHFLMCVVVLSWYSPVSPQWQHAYRRLGHSSSMWCSTSFCRTWTILQSSLHSLGQDMRVKSQLAKCLSSEKSSPIQLQPWVVLLQLTLNDLISHSPKKVEQSYYIDLMHANSVTMTVTNDENCNKFQTYTTEIFTPSWLKKILK